MTAKDRPKVKAECLRLLASLKLDPARTKMIGGFVDSYLDLTAQEMKQYERELARFTPPERNETVGTVTSWERKGRLEGKETLGMRQLRRRFGAVSEEVTGRIDRLSAEQLDDLGEALLDFSAASGLEQWLSRN